MQPAHRRSPRQPVLQPRDRRQRRRHRQGPAQHAPHRRHGPRRDRTGQRGSGAGAPRQLPAPSRGRGGGAAAGAWRGRPLGARRGVCGARRGRVLRGLPRAVPGELGDAAAAGAVGFVRAAWCQLGLCERRVPWKVGAVVPRGPGAWFWLRSSALPQNTLKQLLTEPFDGTFLPPQSAVLSSRCSVSSGHHYPRNPAGLLHPAETHRRSWLCLFPRALLLLNGDSSAASAGGGWCDSSCRRRLTARLSWLRGQLGPAEELAGALLELWVFYGTAEK